MVFGGRPRSPRLTTDALPALDIFRLHRAGALVAGTTTRLQWPHPHPLAPLTVVVRAEAARVMLSIGGANELPVQDRWPRPCTSAAPGLGLGAAHARVGGAFCTW